MITTEYGTWGGTIGGYARLEDSVASVIADFADDYDVDAIVADYREAIDAALPDGVTLAGNQFYGPYPEQRGVALEWPGCPKDEDGLLDIKAIVEGVDLWPIVERHDVSGRSDA